MVLYVIGLGLADENDISLKGLKAIKSCSKVFLEHYTSILPINISNLEKLYENKVLIADRNLVESSPDSILSTAKSENVAFLVVGDPFGATTHSDLILRAKELDIKVVCIHNASIMNAIGVCGLQLYNFGQAVSLVFFDDERKPDSFYDRIAVNRQHGFHTLVLLDIKVKEQSWENMARGKLIYEKPRYMTVNRAIEQLMEIEGLRGQGVYAWDTPAAGFARVGADDQQIVYGTMKELLDVDFGAPLHSLVIPGEMHFLETDYLKTFSIK